MTNKSKGIQAKVPNVFVEISPELAQERGVCDGSLVRLVSPFGAVKLNALITDRVRKNELYLPMNSTDKESAINFLTGPAADKRTNTPAYKQTKVRMEVLGGCETAPLPKTNPRNKKTASAKRSRSRKKMEPPWLCTSD